MQDCVHGEHGGTFHVRGAEGVKSWYEVSILYIQWVYKALYGYIKVYIYIDMYKRAHMHICMNVSNRGFGGKCLSHTFRNKAVKAWQSTGERKQCR